VADGTAEIVAGLVYAPVVDELFWAEKGVGAFVNERRLRVSARRELKDSVLATGIPFAAATASNRMAFARTLGVLMPQVAGVRRFGSAALDLAWVAAGRYDGYWELGVKPWDVAAGLMLVREAGGYATDPRGGDPLDGDVVAANPHLHAKLTSVVIDGQQAAARTP
jgi:myo-inositol-1(or 4)-monophosphatase